VFWCRKLSLSLAVLAELQKRKVSERELPALQSTPFRKARL